MRVAPLMPAAFAGKTGRLLLEALLASTPHHVTALARTPAALDDVAAKHAASGRFNVVAGDLLDAATLAPALAGADVAVFVAGVASIKQVCGRVHVRQGWGRGMHVPMC